jgi:hypothetical protein
MDRRARSLMSFFRFIAFTPLLFGGCNEVYTQFCSDKKETITCLRIESNDEKIASLLSNRFAHLPETESCPFVLQGMRHHVAACKNPVANSIGADFDGYVKLQLFHHGECYYRIQTDFKGDGWESHFEEIADRLEEELAL